jgi:hypothetical protein
VTRARNIKVTALAAVAVTLLSGCGIHPGAAAVVGDQVISTRQVDDVARALCSANSGQGQQLPSRGARQGALRVLLDSEVSRQFGQAQGVQPDKRLVSEAVSHEQSSIQSLPKDQQTAFEQALQGYAEGQATLLAVGSRYLASQGKPTTDQNQDVAEGRRLRGAFSRKLHIQVDPRFGSFDANTGTMAATSGSLSVPVSSSAADGATPDPSAGWVASLPASQKC